MFSVKLDTKGMKKIKWPASDIEVVKAAIALLEAETELPDEKAFPKLNLLRKMIVLAKEETDFDDIVENENAESEASALAKAKDFIRVIVNGLAYFHDHELEKLSEWGLTVEKGKVYPPLGKDMIFEMLQKYVQKELSLPPNFRLPSPPLAQVQAVIKTLALAREKKAKNKNKQKPEVIEHLFNLIQLAAMYHIVLDYDGVVNEEIAAFGFEVVEIPPKQPKVKKQEKAEEKNEPAVPTEKEKTDTTDTTDKTD